MPQRLANSKSDSLGAVECSGSFSLHEAFKQFSAEVPAKQIPCRTSPNLMWRWFEVGSPSQPLLILLHGVCGTAANFFQQLIALRDKGFHVISLQWPAFSSLNSFLNGLDGFVEHLHAQMPPNPNKRGDRPNPRELHLLGAELGGLLALHYAAMRPQIVKSVILCNSFVSTNQGWEAGPSLRPMVAPFLSVLPHAALRMIVITQFLRLLKPLQVMVATPQIGCSNDEDADDLRGAFSGCQPSGRQRRGEYDGLSSSSSLETARADSGIVLLPQESLEIKNSKEFLIAHLDLLSAADLAARLSLHISVAPAEYVPQLDDGSRLLILHTLDSDFPSEAKDGISALFKRAKVATMRTGGSFPFLAAADEVSMHIELHMRRCGAASNRPAAESPSQLPEDDQQKPRWGKEPQGETWSSQEPPDEATWQGYQQAWAPTGQRSLPSSLQQKRSSCNRSTDSEQYQAYASGEYRQHIDAQESQFSDLVYPKHDIDRSILYGRQEQPRYPRKLPQPRLQPDGHALWDRTAASCTSSSQSSSESCYSSGNVQSPVGNQAFLHSGSGRPSDNGPNISEYSS